jgi:putative transposase
MCISRGNSAFRPSRRERNKRSQRAPVPGAHPEKAGKGQCGRRLRADVFEVPANTGKMRAVLDLWSLWQRGLWAETLVARRDLAAGRPLRTTIPASGEALEPEIAASKARVGAALQQMIRAQAIAALASWLTHRQTEMRDAIERQYQLARWRGPAKRRFSTLPEARQQALKVEIASLRHELQAINAQRAWFIEPRIAVMRRRDVGIDDPRASELIPVSAHARRLARAMILGLMAHHRWPRFERLAMRLDERAGFDQGGQRLWLEPADPGGLMAWWLHLKPRGVGTSTLLPIRGWGRDREDDFGPRGSGQFRPGALGKTVNIILDEDGRLKIALTRDVTDAFARARACYCPRMEVLGLDFGLRALFASSAGDLIGRGFLGKIRPLAERAAAEAARMQKAGRRPKANKLYQTLVLRLREQIETEVNRALNYMVALHRPRVLAVERLDFRGSGLGARINRILTNCGRGAVARKLVDLHQRLGIEVHEVDPAYTSQTCSSCGYCDKRSRKGTEFRCRFCGLRMHADVNGARNIAQAAAYAVAQVVSEPSADHGAREAGGRSALRSGSPPAGWRQRRRALPKPRARPRSLLLRELVRRFDESHPELVAVSRLTRMRSREPGARESAPDPRLTNPYWRRFSLRVEGQSKPGRNVRVVASAAATQSP